MLDIIIIGAGPIGLACGIEAHKKGLDYLIFDKGCLVNSLYHYPLNMTFFSTSDKLEIGEVPFISHNSKPTRAEALEYYRRVASHWDLNLNLYESIDKIEKTGSHFNVTTSKASFSSKTIVVATGFYDKPFMLNVTGEDLPKVKHYYTEPHPYFGMDIVVIGAANSAVDVALETYRKGAKSVTMIIREKEIGSNVKYWARPDILNRIKEGSIKAYFEASITKIDSGTCNSGKSNFHAKFSTSISHAGSSSLIDNCRPLIGQYDRVFFNFLTLSFFHAMLKALCLQT